MSIDVYLAISDPEPRPDAPFEINRDPCDTQVDRSTAEAGIKDGQVWLGHRTGGEKWFRVPSSYVHTTDTSKIKVENGVRYLAMKNMAWFTNLDTTKRHETLTLYKRYTQAEYPRYVLPATQDEHGVNLDSVIEDGDARRAAGDRSALPALSAVNSALHQTACHEGAQCA